MKLFTKAATLTLVALATLVSTVPARAESHVARFKIPFQFVVGNEVLPAGQYEMRLDDFNRYSLRRRDEGKTRYVPTSVNYTTRSQRDLGTARLRFTRHGDTMFLSVVWADNQEDGRAVVSSKKLIERADAGSNGAAPSTVSLDSTLK